MNFTNAKAIQVTVFLLAALLSACGGGGGGVGSAPPASEGSATIGAAGGTVQGPDGVVLTLQEQSVANGTTFRIARDSTGAPPLAGMTLLSPIYAVTPHGTELDRHASLSLPYDASKVPAGSNLVILRGETDGTWHVQPNNSTQVGVATADVDSLSYWAVGVCTPGDAGVFGFGIGDCPANQSLSLDVTGIDLTLALHRPVEAPVDFSIRVKWSRPAFVNRVDELLWHGPGMKTGSAQYNGDSGGYYSDFIPVHLDPKTIPGARSPNGVTVHYKALAQYCWTGFIIGRGDNQKVCWSYDVDVPVKVHDTSAPGAPVITSQPQSISVTVGQSAAFSVAATATGTLTIDWQRSDDNGTTFNSLGVTTPSYTLSSASLADSGALLRAHLCDVMDSQQTCIDSASALLTVTSVTVAPTFTLQPGDLSIVSGQTASFTVSATGTPPPHISIYQVGILVDTVVKDCLAPGNGSSNACTYTSATLSASDSGTQFYAVADNAGGSVRSNTATITVTSSAVAPSITTQPATATTSVGRSAGFNVSAGGSAPLSYQWLFNGTPLTDRAAGASTSGIFGSGSANLSLTNAQTADVGNYSVVVSNSVSPVTSQGAALTVTMSTCGAWCDVYPGYNTNRVAFGASSLTGIAVGQNRLLATSDGGANWHPLFTSFTGVGNFFDVAFVDANTVVVVGSKNFNATGLIYRSIDAGSTWTLVSTTTEVPSSITFSGNLGLAATSSSLLRTTDGGATWSSTVTPGFSIIGLTFLPSSTDALASVYNTATNAGELRRSTDGGQTWTLVSPIVGGQLIFRMSFSTPSLGIGFIGATNGTAHIARTTDGGTTWAIIDTGLPGVFNDVLLTPQGVGLAVSSQGGIALSNNFGLTWSSIASGTSVALRGIASPSPGTFVVVGDGVILRNVQSGGGP